MRLGALLRRLGAASPLAPALVYASAALAGSLALRFGPDRPAVRGAALVFWGAAGLLLFVVVTWYRDDDWLAAGFLLALTLLLGGWAADVIAEGVAARSIGGAVFAAAGAGLRVLARAVVTVPAAGGVVALARWVSRRLRAWAPRPVTGAPPA